jgi:hypothetical protein
MPTPPKLDPARGHRGRGPTKLPAEGRQGEPPPWPLPGRRTASEMDAWVELWSTPQAVAWERLGAGCIREVARYCRLRTAAEKPAATAAQQAQVTALADRLGLTPKAMRLLLWEVAADEVAEQRQSSEGDDAPPRIRAVN